MATPSITPITLGSPVYRAVNSAGLLAELSLNVLIGQDFATFTVRFPAATVAPALRLEHGGMSLSLPTTVGATPAASPFADRKIDLEVAVDGTDMVVWVEIRAITNPAAAEPWTVRAGAGAATTWDIGQESNQPGAQTISRVLCDPVADFTVTATTLSGGTVREKDTVTCTAAAAGPTAVGGPVPAIEYTWTKTGPVALPEFPQTGASPTLVCKLPTVYGPRSVTAQLRAVRTGTGLAGVMSKTLSIVPRPQRLALVLDRSGSMAADDRWANAVVAAEVLAGLFVSMRSAVHSGDRIELLVFDDANCSWHTAPASGSIQPVLAMSSIANAALTSVPFGAPGSCTPIGDALIAAIDDFAAAGVGDDPHFTTVLLTDGYENSGTVVVDPNTPAAPGTQRFAMARHTGPRFAVNTAMSLYTIGFGATVQEDVLDALAVDSGGNYVKLTQVGELTEALGQMSAFAAGVELAMVGPPGAGFERVVKIATGAGRAAFSVHAMSGGVVELSYRPQSGGALVPVVGTALTFDGHILVSVDIAALYGGDETAVPATEWHIVYKIGNAPVAITELLAFEDLLVRVDFSFDRDRYDTGDPMQITCRIRAGDDPVPDATVRVELVRPTASLGTFLATGGQEYEPGRTRPPDPAAPKAQMIGELLRRADLTELPTDTSSAVFEDGTGYLVDPDGVGDYRNRYVDTDHEGTYAWRFTISGALPDGGEFWRVAVLSRWVGMGIDPDTTSVDVVALESTERGERTAITVHPRSRRGEDLGPYRPHDVVFRASAGTFDVEVPDATRGVNYLLSDGGSIVSRYDGGYTRVLGTPWGTGARVEITVKGVVLPRIYVGNS